MPKKSSKSQDLRSILAGNVIKVLIRQKYDSWSTFAREIGLAESTLTRILKGRTSPNLDTIEKIALGLEIEAYKLLTPSFEEK